MQLYFGYLSQNRNNGSLFSQLTKIVFELHFCINQPNSLFIIWKSVNDMHLSIDPQFRMSSNLAVKQRFSIKDEQITILRHEFDFSQESFQQLLTDLLDWCQRIKTSMKPLSNQAQAKKSFCRKVVFEI